MMVWKISVLLISMGNKIKRVEFSFANTLYVPMPMSDLTTFDRFVSSGNIFGCQCTTFLIGSSCFFVVMENIYISFISYSDIKLKKKKASYLTHQRITVKENIISSKRG